MPVDWLIQLVDHGHQDPPQSASNLPFQSHFTFLPSHTLHHYISAKLDCMLFPELIAILPTSMHLHMAFPILCMPEMNSPCLISTCWKPSLPLRLSSGAMLSAKSSLIPSARNGPSFLEPLRVFCPLFFRHSNFYYGYLYSCPFSIWKCKLLEGKDSNILSLTVEHDGFGAREPEFESFLCYLLAVWP